MDNTRVTIDQPWLLCPISLGHSVLLTCKCSDSALDVVRVVALDAVQMLSKDERRSGDEYDSGECENSKNAVPDCAFLLQEDPGQEGGKNWITVGGQ